MRCVRVIAPKQPLVFLDSEKIPQAPVDGAVVRVACSGVCHTDVHFAEGGYGLGTSREVRFTDRPGFVYPCTPGHEIAGNIFSVGNGATNDNHLKVGDPVVVFPWLFCDVCRACVDGYSTYCEGGASPPIYIGMTQDGGFADYVAVPNLRCLVPLPASIPLSIACLLPCSGVTAYNAVEKHVDFVKSNMKIKGVCSVLTIGAGGVGQWGLRLARALFPPKTLIICVDVKQEPLDIASRYDPEVVTLLMSPQKTSDDVIQGVRSISAAGVDLVIDFVGTTQTFDIGKGLLKMRGQYNVTGLYGGEANIPIPSLVLNSTVIQGTKVGSLRQLQQLVQIVKEKPSIYANMQYTMYPLEKSAEILKKLAKGEVTGRAILQCA